MGFGQRYSHIMKIKQGPEDAELTEMLDEALQQVAVGDLLLVADELVARHERFVACLGEPGERDNGVSLDPDDLSWITRAVVMSKRDAAALHAGLIQHNVAALFGDLLDSDAPVGSRIEAFTEKLTSHGDPESRLVPPLCLEAATGLLHYTEPQRYWLWSRWLWDRERQTGVLSLLAGSVHNLLADSISESYENVGAVTAMSMRFGEGTGLLVPELMQHPHRKLFASDVFLACAYTVYMYGITSWRLSREFNRLLPTIPRMMRRLLGLTRSKGEKNVHGS